MARKPNKAARPRGEARDKARAATSPSAADTASLNAWQRETRRRYERAGWPLDLPPSDLVGWLHVAVVNDAGDEVKRLVEAGADVNAMHEMGAGTSCLETAAIRGNLGIVETLVGNGADPNHEGEEGTALMCAVRQRHLAVYESLRPLTNHREQKLVARRLSEARRTRAESERAFRFSEACRRGLLPTFHRLLKQGIDIDARTEGFTGLTPLALATKGGQTAIVRRLIEEGADPNLESYRGRTPLMVVTDAVICRLLLEAGADVHAQDDGGRTVLMQVKDEQCLRLIRRALRAKEGGERDRPPGHEQGSSHSKADGGEQEADDPRGPEPSFETKRPGSPGGGGPGRG